MWNLGAKIWDNSPPPADEAEGDGSQDDREKNGARADAGSPEFTDSDGESLNKDLQDGVHEVEAVASVWTTKMLIIAYAMYDEPSLA